MAEIEPLSQFYDEAYREFKDSKMDEEFSELVQTFRKKAINLLLVNTNTMFPPHT